MSKTVHQKNMSSPQYKHTSPRKVSVRGIGRFVTPAYDWEVALPARSRTETFRDDSGGIKCDDERDGGMVRDPGVRAALASSGMTLCDERLTACVEDSRVRAAPAYSGMT